jgi:hypothetical protein
VSPDGGTEFSSRQQIVSSSIAKLGIRSMVAGDKNWIALYAGHTDWLYHGGFDGDCQACCSLLYLLYLLLAGLRVAGHNRA